MDTPIWSLALRRRAVDLSPSEQHLTQALYELVGQRRAQLLGSTRQEVLSGIREESQFRRIQDHLRDFPDVALSIDDYEEAARSSNRCRQGGVATSQTDMLICSVAVRRDWQIFSTDRDFAHHAKVLPIKLFTVR